MTIERSKGKARPTLPRSRELRAVKTVTDPSAGRGQAGRFAPGNTVSVDSGAKHVIAKAMSTEGLQGDSALVARDTRKLFLATLREMPSKSTLVRTGAYGHAREAALAGYYDAKANEAGLDTDRGIKLAERASYHRQRAERLGVTMLDEATRIAGARPTQQGGDLWTALGLKPPAEATNTTVEDVDQGNEPNAATDSRQDEAEEDEPTEMTAQPSTRPGTNTRQVPEPHSEEETRVSSTPAPAITIAPPTASGMRAPQAPTPPVPLCRHGAYPQVCALCFHARDQQQPHSADWRSLLPGARK